MREERKRNRSSIQKAHNKILRWSNWNLIKLVHLSNSVFCVVEVLLQLPITLFSHLKTDFSFFCGELLPNPF